jgi:regulator of sigma E protease
MTGAAIITFFIILFVLVIVHELGHFLFAKLTKMRVDEFAFGFPPRLFGKKIGETLYSFNLIPLGGYVKIFGENRLDEGVTNEKDRSFESKSAFARILVLAGGVLFNIIAAVFLFTFSFMNSPQRVITPEESLNIPFNERKVMIAQISEKSAFYKNPFFMEGTEILSMGTQKENIPNEKLNSASIGKLIEENQNSIIRIEYKTTIEGETVNKVAEVVPLPGILEGKKALGLGFVDIANKGYTTKEAFINGFKFTFASLETIFIELWKLVKNLFAGNAKIQDSLSGPIGLAMITQKVSEQGIERIFFLAGMLSLSLAAFNILPIPALDGGRILFVLLEVITRRKMPIKIEQSFHTIGFLLLIGLMIFVTYFDILKIM